MESALINYKKLNDLEGRPWVLASCQVLLISLHCLGRRSRECKQFTDDNQNDDGHRVITIDLLSLRLGFATKLKSDALKVPKTSSNQKGWCNKPTKFKSKKISQNVTNKPKSNVELVYMSPRQLPGSPAVILIIHLD